MVAGFANKQTAGDLGTSEITIGVHRGQIMRKMGARSLAELVRMADKLGIARHQYPGINKHIIGTVLPLPLSSNVGDGFGDGRRYKTCRGGSGRRFSGSRVHRKPSGISRYAHLAFSSAEEFLQSGALAIANCLITDVRMPGMDGIELQRRIQTRAPGLTGHLYFSPP